MKKKPELDDVDVVFDSSPLTEAEKALISEYIRKDKARRKRKQHAKPFAGTNRADVIASVLK